jgi:hypothetical protein
LTRKELQLEVARQLKQAKDHPFYYFSKVKTFDEDELDTGERVKPYPINKKYLQNLVYLAETEKRLAVYKARRMIVTWTFCGVASRELLLFPGSHTAFISKKEEDAGKLVGRVKFIYEHLPSYWRLGLPEPHYYRAKKAIFVKIVCKHPNGLPDSVLEAYPEGGEQLVGDGFSMIYWDEVGKIDDKLCEITYAGAVPALGKHGKLFMSSTPPRYPQHFWHRLCEGTYLG